MTRFFMTSYDDLEMCSAVDQNCPNGGNFDWLQNYPFAEFEQNGLDATAYDASNGFKP